MGAINEIDIAKLVLLPAVLYVAKKIIDWAGKVNRHRFNRHLRVI